jgi:hypothetical protein
VHNAVCTSVGPDDTVVQGFARLCVPDAGGFALVGYADGFDIGEGVAFGLELFASFVYAFAGRGDKLERVMFMPPKLVLAGPQEVARSK